MWVDRSPGWFIRRRESQENRRWKIKGLTGWKGLLSPISHLPCSHLPGFGWPGAGMSFPISHAPILPSPGGVAGVVGWVGSVGRFAVRLRLA